MRYSNRLKSFRPIFLAAVFCMAVSQAHAASEITFSISGMDTAQVMRFKDDPGKVRIGYIQSTQFSHSVHGKSKKPETSEDGIFYYSLIVEKLPDGTFQMDISYDFA